MSRTTPVPTNASSTTMIAGVRLRAPMLDIHTVAAGGGSILAFDGCSLPGGAPTPPAPIPVRRVTALVGRSTVTDANVMLGRIQPGAYFPQGLRSGRRPADRRFRCPAGVRRPRQGDLGPRPATTAPQNRSPTATSGFGGRPTWLNAVKKDLGPEGPRRHGVRPDHVRWRLCTTCAARSRIDPPRPHAARPSDGGSPVRVGDRPRRHLRRCGNSRSSPGSNLLCSPHLVRGRRLALPCSPRVTSSWREGVTTGPAGGSSARAHLRDQGNRHRRSPSSSARDGRLWWTEFEAGYRRPFSFLMDRPADRRGGLGRGGRPDRRQPDLARSDRQDGQPPRPARCRRTTSTASAGPRSRCYRARAAAGRQTRSPARRSSPRRTPPPWSTRAGRPRSPPYGHLLLERVGAAGRATTTAGTAADPVLLEIFNNLFMSIAEQMGAAPGVDGAVGEHQGAARLLLRAVRPPTAT